jgi:hypothetical protein
MMTGPADQPSDAAVAAVRLAEEPQHVEPISESAWLTAGVVAAIDRLIDQGVIAAGLHLRDAR